MDTGKGWVYMPRNGPEYREGVNNFIQSSLNTSAFNGRIKCPCKRCAVTVYLDPKDVREHLFCVGFDKNYANSIWVFHGEEPSPSRVDDEVLSDEESNDGAGDDLYRLLHDAFGFPSSKNILDDFPQAGEGETNLEVQKFHQLMQDAKTELYPGCDKFTNLSFILRLHQMKCLYRWSDTSLNHMLQLINDVLPNGSNLPKNLYQMKKIMADLGLGYTKIDACPNDCMLYWKEKVNDEKCNVCDVSRWKDPLIGKKSGPAKDCSNRNFDNRMKSTMAHHLGTKSLARLREEMTAEDGEAPDRLKVFEKAYGDTKKKPVDPISEMKLASVKNHKEKLPPDCDIVSERDKIFELVVGEDKRGYKRTYGIGVKVSTKGSSMHHNTEAIHMVEEEVKKRKALEEEVEIEKQKRLELEQEISMETDKRKELEENMLSEKRKREALEEEMQTLKKLVLHMQSNQAPQVTRHQPGIRCSDTNSPTVRRR